MQADISINLWFHTSGARRSRPLPSPLTAADVNEPRQRANYPLKISIIRHNSKVKIHSMSLLRFCYD